DWKERGNLGFKFGARFGSRPRDQFLRRRNAKLGENFAQKIGPTEPPIGHPAGGLQPSQSNPKAAPLVSQFTSPAADTRLMAVRSDRVADRAGPGDENETPQATRSLTQGRQRIISDPKPLAIGKNDPKLSL